VTTLSETFLAALPAEARQSYAERPDLDAELAALVAAGRQAWPSVTLDNAVFVSQVARVVADRDAEDALSSLQAGELYLACACGQGDEEAARRFRQEAEQTMRAALTKVVKGELLDEVLQQAMTKILVGDGQPAVLKFAGRGKLAAWARVTALRLGYDARRREKREPVDAAEELFDQAVVVERDPQLEKLKRTYRSAFRRAFSTALDELSVRERAVLRYCYLDGLNIDEVGVLFGVHRATVARWRVKARESLFERTREIFQRDFNLDTDEMSSVMRLIESQLSISVGGLQDTDPSDEA
jgi:RNA polymerase sigma-70 factor (ECF subfamily)